MERIGRTPFQGVSNIVRFNWHFYVIGAALIVLLIIASLLAPVAISLFITIVIGLTVLGIIFSLAVSHYVYDRSHLYTLDWLEDLAIPEQARIITINAGFDETSVLLAQKFPKANLTVFDFYDPAKHTEISIERARKAYSIFPGTISIRTSHVPLERGVADYIFLILAAHEIRDPKERIQFFDQLQESLKPGGSIIVTAHLRDVPNFIAYNFGFFHFFSKKEWKDTFTSADLNIIKENKITPFISTFILRKNGTAS
jgi:SAM-dependent methyltransferase